eukprot:CAMPEP_0206280920 /NCGR_PEP_ID=MMETSP0047_2-20121206/38843_1 /ASSEMBLY_ACC=CAM_ASM_000192 /TAXON_ID=195065 /ORGANISM="Chroomonas mesostigmatica_cf, Strain CCMP1168" /LENGTH=136 /DNA_ID=CAMNT_0053711029 /DNA_START=90 /DNA_END=497 /DNA_ORIENTATION=-
MLPIDVDVAPERIAAPIGLGDVDDCAGLRMLEADVSSDAKRSSNGDVLLAVWRERCPIVVIRFPVISAPVPVEPCGLHIHVKVLRHPIDYPRERGGHSLPLAAHLLVVGYAVRVPMPHDPQAFPPLLKGQASLRPS